MTQEEKLLVKKELSARAFYGVKAHYQYYDFVGSSERLVYEKDGVVKGVDISLRNPVYIDGIHADVEHTKPYLRPMSSMTEEEKEEFQAFHCIDGWHPYFYQQMCNIPNLENMFNWLNAHHFDYHGLIEKGLALEAPEGMYKFE